MIEHDQALAELVKLYKPCVSQGNFMPDVSNRGKNAMLATIVERLGIASQEEWRAECDRLDAESWERSERAIARANAEDRDRGT